MMNLKHKNGAIRGGSDQANERVVLIAVKASRDISRNALVWALNHVVQPGDCAKLLVIIPVNTPSNKSWGFSKFNSDCTTRRWKSLSGLNIRAQKDDIQESCSQIVLQLHDLYASDKIKMKNKVVSAIDGVVATEAKKTLTQWVVLDKKLKKEAKICIEQLECNVVVMKKSHPKVVRLNLAGSLPDKETPAECLDEDESAWSVTKVPNVTPVSSPDRLEPGNNKLSSFDLGFSPYFVADHDWDLKKDGSNTDVDTDTDSENAKSSPSTNSSSEFLKNTIEKSLKLLNEQVLINPITDKHRLKFTELDHTVKRSTKNLPETVRLTRTMPPKPPPLCSFCQHKAPAFEKPPKRFGFRELEEATNGFSRANFLAEGGFGSVHRGVLKDGRMVAVKKHKLASSQGDNEFFSEVDVLSCAQHRNVVMLIGFCVEDTRRLLVYEFICNGSLDSHLYGHDHGTLEWSARQKIAIRAARGLRYLHEECRVGCIVHRDMRPNNILLTHDFEALVGDFGLARCQPDGDMGVETRIIGTFGYLAPEYAQSGEITEKADVYSFGVVLVELITGRKAVDITRPKGQKYLTDWARPLLEENAIAELMDPRLKDSYIEPEVRRMTHCASLCIRRDPYSRPRMSQVLWMLENDNIK